MPMYEYHCEQCGAEFEELVSSSTRDSEVECPECEREGGAQRKLSAFAVAGSAGLGSGSTSGFAAGGGSGFS